MLPPVRPVWHLRAAAGKLDGETPPRGRWRQCAPQNDVRKKRNLCFHFLRDKIFAFELHGSGNQKAEKEETDPKPAFKSACRLKRGIKRAARFPQIPAVQGFSKALGWHQKRGAGISQGTASQADRKISGKTKDFPAFSRGIKTGVKPISNDILKYF